MPGLSEQTLGALPALTLPRPRSRSSSAVAEASLAPRSNSDTALSRALFASMYLLEDFRSEQAAFVGQKDLLSV
jgi:hypothetical protein